MVVPNDMIVEVATQPDMLTQITQWGVAGAVIIVVALFLIYLERKDRAFTATLDLISERNAKATSETTDALRALAVQCERRGQNK